jgi:GntR family transcriptional regulator
MTRPPARYVEIAAVLEAEVLLARPATLLAPEEQLAVRFDVSRVTVRRALDLLERQGLITRRRGRGTMVSPAKLVRHLIPARTIEQDFRSQGVLLATRITEIDDAAPASDEVRYSLRLAAADPVTCVAIGRSTDSEPLLYEKHYFSTRLARQMDLGALEDTMEDTPLSHLLEKAAGHPITRSYVETEVVSCSAEAAYALRITPGTLVTAQHFREYTADGTPLQIGSMFYRIDKVRFHIVQEGPPYLSDEVRRPA